VRSTAIENVDLSFMKNRKAFICPVGRGTDEDKKLSTTLTNAGAETSTLVWQLIRPEGDGYKMVRKDVPENYGAEQAVEEGWKGEKMAHLLKLSQNKEKEELRKTKNLKDQSR
jgi:hypothetical protein